MLNRAHVKILAKLAAFAKTVSFAMKSQVNANALKDAKHSEIGKIIESRTADAVQQMKTMFASCQSSLVLVRKEKVANGTLTASDRNASDSDKMAVD